MGIVYYLPPPPHAPLPPAACVSMLSQVRGPKCAARLAATLADGPPGGPDVFVLDGGWSGFVSGPARRGLCEGVDTRMWGGGA